MKGSRFVNAVNKRLLVAGVEISSHLSRGGRRKERGGRREERGERRGERRTIRADAD